MALDKELLRKTAKSRQLSDDEQVEFIKLTGKRLEQVKNAIPQIETADEARSFVVGSIGTLVYLAEELLPPDVYKDLNEYIDSETKVLNFMVERLRLIE